MKRAGHPDAPRGAVRPGSYAILWALCAAIVIPSHLWLARLPYYWDEAGQFIPAALDILRHGWWIPHSAPPSIHPPAVAAYLAAVWRIAGFTPAATRLAMLALASSAVLAAFLLAIELGRGARGAPAFLAAGLLCASPPFFAQSLLAQLDMPAMLFTTLALLCFLEERVRLAAAVCVALVLVRETGLVVPLVLGGWLLAERRWRDAAWFAAPVAVMALWIAMLLRFTGNWAGNAAFLEYNLRDPLHPLRLAVTLARRLYFLLFANFHWVGAIAIVYAWRRKVLFGGRSWRIAWLLLAAHIVMFTLLGGAVLNRYLLPVLPVWYAAMATALSGFGRAARLAAGCVLLGGVAASNWINPPYPFPFEENLAFADFVRLQSDAADYISHRYGDPVVSTTWPLSAELSQPDLGYVTRPIRVEALPDLTAQRLKTLDWDRVQVLAVFSVDWDPPLNPLHLTPLLNFWERVYHYVPGANLAEARALVPFPIEAHFDRRGQWVEIYVNPSLRFPRRPDAAPRAHRRSPVQASRFLRGRSQ